MSNIDNYNKILELFEKKAQGTFITTQELQQYFIPEIDLNIKIDRFQIQNYYCRLASSLQNSGNMQNSIKFNDEKSHSYEIIKKTLFDFDAKKVLAEYNTSDEIYEKLKKNGIRDNAKDLSKNTNWKKYAKGLFEGADFLLNQNGEEKIQELIALNSSTTFNQEWLERINEITKIHGLGFALTCDWLKECGCTWLAKPDTHINTVYNVLNGKEEKATVKEKEVIEYMFNWAKEIKNSTDNSMTPYKLDKIIWLICTGNFYLHKDKMINRDALVNVIKQTK